MKHRKVSRLGIKFIVVTLPLIAVFIILVGINSINNERKVLYALLDNFGTSITQAAASFSVEPLLIKDYPVLQTYTDKLIETNNAIVSVKIYRKDGGLLAGSGRDAADSETLRTYEERIRVFSGSNDGIGKVVVVVTPEQFDSVLQNRIYEGIISASVLFIMLSILVFVLMKKLVAEPLCLLDKQASAMGEGDLDSHISLKSEDELGSLADTLEKVREKLKMSYSRIETQNGELKGLDRMKDEFLATMSHELRTPLNAIIGYSEIAREDVELESYQSLGRDLERIGSSAKHLLAIVDDVLDLSRLASGNAVLKLRPCSLQKTVNELEIFHDPRLQKNNNRFITELNHEVDKIMIDPDRLRQVLLNLLSNANKFTCNGVIKVVTRQEVEGDRVWNYIDVEDDGIGMEPQFLDKIFISFFQVDSSATRQYEGTGLGLTVSSRLCKCMGGDIAVQSTPNKGTVFTVKIPSPLTGQDEVAQDCQSLQASIL